MKASRFAMIVSFFLSAFALNTRATTYYTDATLGNNSYDGLSSMVSGGNGPKLNILSAILEASSGDAIQSATGSYQEYLWDSGTNSVTLNPQGSVTVDAVDAFQVDSIGDGIADGWRLAYFGSGTTTNSASCATCDPDGDTYNNLQEYTLNTDPTNSVSYPPSVGSTNQITSAPIIDWEFADTFNVTNLALSLYPTNRVFFFRVGDSVAISNSDSGVIDVWNVKGGRVYRGAASGFTNSLSPGHYFVESRTDRLQFCMLPSGYTNAPGWGADNQSLSSDYYAYGVSLGIKTVRFFAYWYNLTSPSLTWGQYDFTDSGCGVSGGCGLDPAIAEAASASNNLIIQLESWPQFATNAADCTLARYLEYVSNVCTHIANATNGNVVTGFTLWNEPDYHTNNTYSFLFTVPDSGSLGSPSLDWDWSQPPFNGTPVTWEVWLSDMYTAAVPVIKGILIKEAVIFASRGVLPIFQEGLTGGHSGGQDLWFAGFASGEGSDLTRGPYPRISAWAAVWHQLKGLSFVGQAGSTNGVISYTFASGTTTNVYRWCIRGVSTNLSTALDCKDVFGNTEHTSFITDEPLIFNQ